MGGRVHQYDIFTLKPYGDGNQRLADAGPVDAIAVGHAEQRAMGGAEDVFSVIVNTPLR